MVVTYEDLVAALKARRQSLGLSQLAVDDMAGLSEGYVSKLEMSLTNPRSPTARAIGRDSLPLLLGALGVKLALVSHMPAASEHGEKLLRFKLVIGDAAQKFMSDRGRRGAWKTNGMRSPMQRRRAAQKAARARWRKA
jgi:transcriptional regulator with XRE-family HTH domain